MARPHLTEQERIDSATLRMDDPSRIVGSGYIQFPPQRPFSQPLTRQPPTITGEPIQRGGGRGGDSKPQRQRPNPGPGYPSQLGNYPTPKPYQQRGQPRPQMRQEPQHRSHGGSYSQASGQHVREPNRPQQASQPPRALQQNGSYRTNPKRPTIVAQANSQAAATSQPARADGGQISGHSTTDGASLRPTEASTQNAQAAGGLDSALDKLSLQEKAAQEEPLSKAQAKRLRKKLREGRAEL